MKLKYTLIKKLSPFKVFLLISLILFISIFGLYIYLIFEDQKYIEKTNQSIDWNQIEETKRIIEQEREFAQTKALEVIEEESDVLGQNDTEVERIPVGYKEELVDWSENVNSLLYIVDDTYYLINQNDEKQLEYIDLLDLFGSTCIFKDYPYSKSDIPKEYLDKVRNVEELLPSFCKLLVENSKVLKNYENSTNVVELEKLYREDKELNKDIYIKGDIIYRLLEDIEKVNGEN